MRNVLFVCSRNRLRSPMAEQIFSERADIEVASAGTNHDADTPLSSELVKWADVIFVMEKVHRRKLQRQYRADLILKQIICLDIADDYEFTAPDLVRLLEDKITRHLVRRLRINWTTRITLRHHPEIVRDLASQWRHVVTNRSTDNPAETCL